MTNTDLRIACEAWQGGRDSGSSPIRGAARRLTGTRHYFDAPFIAKHEQDVSAADFQSARTLLSTLSATESHDAAGWASLTGLDSSWVGRGISGGEQDSQIRESLSSGSLTMALWGSTFDRSIAARFGSAFTFELLGAFPAIPAWVHSGLKAEEQELIVGGRYSVESLSETTTGGMLVRLRFIGGVDILEA